MGSIRLRSSISLSILFHGFLIAAWAMYFGLYGHKANPVAPKHTTWIEVEPLKESEKTAKAKLEDPKQKMVQTEAGKKTATPAPDAFLGERNQTVDRETVSRNKITSAGGASAKAQANKAKAQQQEPESTAVAKIPGKSGTLSQFGIPILPPSGQQPQHAQADDSAVAPIPGAPQDYVKGYKESDKTSLNTREYVFYGYFQRIRQRLDWAWDKSLKEQMKRFRRRGRQLATDTDHTTRIMVTLNQTGEVVQVQVVEASGTTDLDDAAVKAFNEAGPFPNPPSGIADTKGHIKIRWDFVLRT